MFKYSLFMKKGAQRFSVGFVYQLVVCCCLSFVSHNDHCDIKYHAGSTSSITRLSSSDANSVAMSCQKAWRK